MKFTKRGLLSVNQSIFDPCNLLLPVIMLMRILLQVDWDEQVDDSIKKDFQKCISSLGLLRQVSIPRWTGMVKGAKYELIGFCDGSGDGYAAVIYGRIKINAEFIVRLIAARGRVTPLKTKANIDSKLMTIPKIELEGLKLLSELYKQVAANFTEVELTFTAYTDSEVVLAWVRREKESDMKVVKRRVAAIKKVINPRNLHYVRSAENVADFPSRGMMPAQLVECKEWWEGPKMLYEEELSTSPFKEPKEEDDWVEIHATINETEKEDFTDFIARFSCFMMLLKVVAHALRWASKDKPRGPLTAEEITEAKIRVIRFQQKMLFGKEIEQLLKGKHFWFAIGCRRWHRS